MTMLLGMILPLAFTMPLHRGSASPSAATTMGRERELFNADWKFQAGDAGGDASELSYDSLKPWLLDPARPNSPDGGPLAANTFDDSSWQSVRLPHDWAIQGPFKQEYPSETGKLKWWGVGWYRKHFSSPTSDAGKNVYVEFGGAMSYSSVWLNGHFVGGRPYGYSSFRVDLSRFLKPGSENVIAVRLDNPEDSSRWYPGAGIYRNVWLVKTGPTRIAYEGVQITTPFVRKDLAEINVKLALHREAESSESVSATTQFFFGNRSVGISKINSVKWDNEIGSVVLKSRLPNPHLWSPDAPHLYWAVTTVRQGEAVLDVVKTNFGVRSILFDPKIGFLLNGKKTFMRGVCLHHDLGAIGIAFNSHAAERQLSILKSMGCNALRTSHNPPAPEMLDLCDRMGILVMDEFSDTWTHAKKPFGYARLFADWHEADLRGLVRRDINHPCVVMWSTGNEVAEQVAKGGKEISKMLTSIVHEEDPTRPVASGDDQYDAGFNGYADTLDVFGYNYKPHVYGKFISHNPKMPLFGSETASTLSSRGEYFFPLSDKRDSGEYDFQVNSYDLDYPGWASTPDMEFKGQDENPSVFGEFVWTGFDYLGEPTPDGGDSSTLPNFQDPVLKAVAKEQLATLGHVLVPSRSSYFGIVDLAGFPKDRYYLYQARWRPELRIAHLLPDWNWADRVGKVTPVHLYTSGDEAELFLNGRSLGRKKLGKFEYRLRWDDVIYEPGELKAVAYKNGKQWATDVMRTTGPASKLILSANRKLAAADGDDLVYITAQVSDSSGAMVPHSKNQITFTISGPGEIIATDNGDATDHTSFPSHERRAFNGLCLVIVRTKPGERGAITVSAKSPDLHDGKVTIAVR